MAMKFIDTEDGDPPIFWMTKLFIVREICIFVNLMENCFSLCHPLQTSQKVSNFGPLCPFGPSMRSKNIAKGITTWGLSSAYQNNFFRPYLKFLYKSWPKFIFRILTKDQLQNLNQISAFRLNLNFEILTKNSFRISTKNDLHNLNQGSAVDTD